MLDRIIKKAQSSICHSKVGAIALGHKGEILGYARNSPRFQRQGGGLHAEMRLMARYGKNIKSIIICRTNKKGGLLPIDPCDMCLNKATELGIKIYRIGEV